MVSADLLAISFALFFAVALFPPLSNEIVVAVNVDGHFAIQLVATPALISRLDAKVSVVFADALAPVSRGVMTLFTLAADVLV